MNNHALMALIVPLLFVIVPQIRWAILVSLIIPLIIGVVFCVKWYKHKRKRDKIKEIGCPYKLQEEINSLNNILNDLQDFWYKKNEVIGNKEFFWVQHLPQFVYINCALFYKERRLHYAISNCTLREIVLDLVSERSAKLKKIRKIKGVKNA